MRKPVFWLSDQVRQKPGCTITEDGQMLESLDLRSTHVDEMYGIPKCQVSTYR